MANLFNSNPLMGLGLALSTFGGQESMGNAMNLLNYAQRQQLIDDEKQKELRKEATAAAYLKNSGQLDLPKPDVMTDISNALNGVKPQQQRPLTIGERIFNGYGDNIDTNKVDLMRAAGSENLLNSKLAAMAEASKPRELAANAILTDATGRVIARNDKPPEIPGDAALVKYYQSLPDGPEKQQLGAIIQQKIGGAAKSSWRPPTAEEMARYHLDPTGSYQIDQNGNVNTITQPKQANPTEAQQKYEYNANRVIDALGAVQPIVKRNPEAVSNWMLNATDNSPIPGLDALGRKFTSEDAQLVRNNLGDAIDAIITLGTGAAYTKEQLAAARNSYIPQPGEGKPVVQDKFRKLISLYSSAAKNARSAGKDLPDASVFADIYGVRRPNEPAGASGGWGPIKRIK